MALLFSMLLTPSHPPQRFFMHAKLINRSIKYSHKLLYLQTPLLFNTRLSDRIVIGIKLQKPLCLLYYWYHPTSTTPSPLGLLIALNYKIAAQTALFTQFSARSRFLVYVFSISILFKTFVQK